MISGARDVGQASRKRVGSEEISNNNEGYGDTK